MSSHPAPQAVRHIIGELGRQVSDATILLHEALARQAGLSVTDHKYLGLLVRHGALTPGEWAKLTGLSTGATTGLIDRLEEKQLVCRQPDAADRRKIVVVPNAARTQSVFGGPSAELQRRVEQLVDTLRPEEAAVVERYLRASIDLMQAFTQQLHEQPRFAHA